MGRAKRKARRGYSMNAFVRQAFDAGTQPKHIKNGSAVVTAPNQKTYTLANKEGQVSKEGRYWYEELHKVSAPTLYEYEQPLIRGTHVKRFDGTEIKVRQPNKDGTATITALGRNYFKYNRSEFVVYVPYLRAKYWGDGVYEVKHPKKQHHLDTWYKPLFDCDIDPSGNMPLE